jgi:hypothetical protein
MDEGESWRRVTRDEEGERERRSDACNFFVCVYQRSGVGDIKRWMDTYPGMVDNDYCVEVADIGVR